MTGPTDVVERCAEIILGKPDVYRFGLTATLSVDGSAEPRVGPSILVATVEPNVRADAVRQAIRQVNEVLADLPLTTAVLPRDVGLVNEAFDHSTYLLRWTVSGDTTTPHVATHAQVRSESPAASATEPAQDFAACYSVVVRDMGTPLTRASEPASETCAYPFNFSALTPRWYGNR